MKDENYRKDLQALLDRYASEYNAEGFADSDPVQFARRFDSLPDREIASLLVSTISWGRRPMILRNAEKLLGLLEGEPHHFVLEGDIDSISDDNIHRTFFGRHLRYYLRGLRELYRKYGTLENFAAHTGADAPGEAPAWAIATGLRGILADANRGCEELLQGPDRCLPSKPETSALKRLNMALRWLVRRDGIVDPGGWELFGPERLYIPMDVHVCNTSAALGLLDKAPKSPDRKTAVALTDALREFRPDDPTVYDFALFGLGVNGALPSINL
ncbi:MAG: TIGR02757 family protein [Muribaculaceae bacterium]|nr:TIGR02757 family protein [Muribaculaceae bacterium]